VLITLNVPKISVSQALTRRLTLVLILLNLVPTIKLFLTRTLTSSPKNKKLNGWDNVLLSLVAYLALLMLNVTTTKDVPKTHVSTNSVSTNQSIINGAILNLKDKKSLSKHLINSSTKT